MGDFYTYILVFWPHLWAAILAGALFGADEIGEKWWPEMMPRFREILRPYWLRIRVVVLIGAVFYAGYAAWLDEHKLRVEANQETAKTKQEAVRAEAERDEARRQLNEKIASYAENPSDMGALWREIEELSPKRLNASQAKTLLPLLAESKEKIGKLYFGSYHHSDTILFVADILDILRRAGLEIVDDYFTPDRPDQTGVMLTCDTPENPPNSALVVMDIFRKAGVEVSVTQMLSKAKKDGISGCMLYVGPNPL